MKTNKGQIAIPLLIGGGILLMLALSGDSLTESIGLNISQDSISIIDSYRLPQLCSDNEIAKFNGLIWYCSQDNIGSGGDMLQDDGTYLSTNASYATGFNASPLLYNGVDILYLFQNGSYDNTNCSEIGSCNNIAYDSEINKSYVDSSERDTNLTDADITAFGYLKDSNDTVEGNELIALMNTTGILIRSGQESYTTIVDNSSAWNTQHDLYNTTAEVRSVFYGSPNISISNGVIIVNSSSGGGGTSYVGGQNISINGNIITTNETLKIGGKSNDALFNINNTLAPFSGSYRDHNYSMFLTERANGDNIADCTWYFPEWHYLYPIYEFCWMNEPATPTGVNNALQIKADYVILNSTKSFVITPYNNAHNPQWGVGPYFQITDENNGTMYLGTGGRGNSLSGSFKISQYSLPASGIPGMHFRQNNANYSFSTQLKVSMFEDMSMKNEMQFYMTIYNNQSKINGGNQFEWMDRSGVLLSHGFLKNLILYKYNNIGLSDNNINYGEITLAIGTSMTNSDRLLSFTPYGMNISKSNYKLWFGNTSDVEIYYNGANLIVNTTRNSKNSTVYFTSNISATGFTTRTPKIKDNLSIIKYLDKLLPSSDILDSSGKIKKEVLTNIELSPIKEYTNCRDMITGYTYTYEEVYKSDCIGYNGKDCIEWDNASSTMATTTKPNKGQDIQEHPQYVTVCDETEEMGTSVDGMAVTNKIMISELKQKTNDIETKQDNIEGFAAMEADTTSNLIQEIAELKAELCKYNDKYGFC